MQLAQAIGAANSPKDAIGPIRPSDLEHPGTPFEGFLKAGEEAEKNAEANTLLLEPQDETDVRRGSEVGEASPKAHNANAENENPQEGVKNTTSGDPDTPFYAPVDDAPAPPPQARHPGEHVATQRAKHPADANMESARLLTKTDAKEIFFASSSTRHTSTAHTLHPNGRAQDDTPKNVDARSHSSDTKSATVIESARPSADSNKQSPHQNKFQATGYTPLRTDHKKTGPEQLPVFPKSIDAPGHTAPKATPMSAMVEGLSVANSSVGRSDPVTIAQKHTLTHGEVRKAAILPKPNGGAIQADTVQHSPHNYEKKPLPQLTDVAAENDQGLLPSAPPQSASHDTDRPIALTNQPNKGAFNNTKTSTKLVTDSPHSSGPEFVQAFEQSQMIIGHGRSSTQIEAANTAYESRLPADMRTMSAALKPDGTASPSTRAMSVADVKSNPRADNTTQIKNDVLVQSAPQRTPRLSSQTDVKTAAIIGPKLHPDIAQVEVPNTAFDRRTPAETRIVSAQLTPNVSGPPIAHAMGVDDVRFHPQADTSEQIEKHGSEEPAPPTAPRLSSQTGDKIATISSPKLQPDIAQEQVASTARAAAHVDMNFETEIPVWDVRPHTGHSSSTTLPIQLHRAEMPPHTSQAIAEAFRKSPDKPIELTLNPTELGRVRMVMTTQDAGIIVTITAERGDTLDLMRRNIDDLGRSLNDLGFEDVSFAFEQGQNTSSEQDDGGTDDGPANMAHLQDETDTAGATTTHAARPHIATTGIDMRL